MLQVRLRDRSIFLCILTLLVLGSTVPALAQSAERSAAPEAIEPDERKVVKPCCDSQPEGDWVARKGWPEGSAPKHAMLDPDTEAAYRERAIRDTRAMPMGGAPGAGSDPSTGGTSPVPFKQVPTKNLRRLTSFGGLDTGTAGHGGQRTFPPDTVIAASPTKVLEAANVGMRLTARDGSAPVNRSMNNFFGEATAPLIFDPKVYFDRLSNRFFLIALQVNQATRQSSIFVTVSRSSDPQTLDAPADWCSYEINAVRKGGWADFPGLGVNERFVAISDNHFTFGDPRFVGAFLWVLDKDSLVDNAAACPNMVLHKFSLRLDADAEFAFTVQPAQHYSTNNFDGTPLFMVSSQVQFFSSDVLTLWRIKDRGVGRKPQVQKFRMVTDQPYSWPPNAEQDSGPLIDTGDPRVQQVAYRNGKVWAVLTTGCNFGGEANESCVRAIEITPTDTGGSITFDRAAGGGDRWYYWMPGVAVNADGDIVMPFQRARFNKDLGAGYVGKRAGSETFDTPRVLRQGRCGIANVGGGSTTSRSGDYVGAQTDPMDNLGFWVAGEIADQVTGSGCSWRTWVLRLKY